MSQFKTVEIADQQTNSTGFSRYEHILNYDLNIAKECLGYCQEKMVNFKASCLTQFIKTDFLVIGLIDHICRLEKISWLITRRFNNFKSWVEPCCAFKESN